MQNLVIVWLYLILVKTTLSLFLKMKDSWGQLTTLNLYGCRKSLIRNPKKIENFCLNLCKEIEMKAVGKPLIKRFGKGNLEGYSAVQLIETSTITIHFDEIANRAFIDIFSCKKFDSKRADNFAKNYFSAYKSKVKTMIRR